MISLLKDDESLPFKPYKHIHIYVHIIHKHIWTLDLSIYIHVPYAPGMMVKTQLKEFELNSLTTPCWTKDITNHIINQTCTITLNVAHIGTCTY